MNEARRGRVSLRWIDPLLMEKGKGRKWDHVLEFVQVNKVSGSATLHNRGWRFARCSSSRSKVKATWRGFWAFSRFEGSFLFLGFRIRFRGNLTSGSSKLLKPLSPSPLGLRDLIRAFLVAKEFVVVKP